MRNKTRGKSDGTETKGETKRKKRTKIPGRARERERVGKENQAREFEKAVVTTEEKKHSGKRGFLPTNRGFPVQSFLFVVQSICQ